MTRTANQMIVAVGQVVVVRMESFGVDCIVKDVKQAWGQTRLLVSPIKGTGEAWVDCSRCGRAYSAGSEITA